MKKIYALSLLLASLPLSTDAQNAESTTVRDVSVSSAFNRLDLAVTTGTTGIGFELSTPIHPIATLRTGFTFMPKIKPVMTFSVEGRGKNGEVTKFGDLADNLQEFIGYEVDEEIDMVGEPTFYNFSILVDVHPFENKNWHVTAGVYMGPNEIANACNKTEEMPSLLALGIYNKLHDKVANFEAVYGDLFLDPDEGIGKKLMDKGRMGIYIGEFDNGKPYLMEPDANGMVKVRMKTNTFVRPYIGFGYGGRLIKGDDRCHISFDCGAMFWGGAPKVITHDGVNLTKDLSKIRGQVNDYVKIVKGMPVYPVLNLKIAYQLF